MCGVVYEKILVSGFAHYILADGRHSQILCELCAKRADTTHVAVLTSDTDKFTPHSWKN